MQASEGEPRFLLVHGFAQNRRAFTVGPIVDLLRDAGAAVFLGELRGHGMSRTVGPARHGVCAHLEHDLPALLGAVGDRVHLVGHSMGGILGYALLPRSPRIASLTTLGAPIDVGRGRLRLYAASAVAPFLRGHRNLPMDHFLRWLSRSPRTLSLAGLSAHARSASGVQHTLANGDPEPARVLGELAQLVWRGKLCGVEIARAVTAAPVPVAAIVGSKDFFANRRSVDQLERGHQAGPRWVREIEGAGHVDLAAGAHLYETIPALLRFLAGA